MNREINVSQEIRKFKYQSMAVINGRGQEILSGTTCYQPPLIEGQCASHRDYSQFTSGQHNVACGYQSMASSCSMSICNVFPSSCPTLYTRVQENQCQPIPIACDSMGGVGGNVRIIAGNKNNGFMGFITEELQGTCVNMKSPIPPDDRNILI